ncbi:MAG: zinc ribbon domain-containing protein [Methanomassiliicoccus sp.]|nr:zinc ribbon domain-containing protein [Methanomassiliicoccus sp.]
MSDESVLCPQCGSTVKPGSGYCTACGKSLSGGPPTPPPSSPFAGWGSSAKAREALLMTMGRRQQTDIKISEYWILLPVVAVVASYVLGLISFIYYDMWAGLTVTIVGTIVAVILIAFLIFRLLKRRNEHMARESALRREIMDFFRFRGEEKGIGHLTDPYVQAMQAFDHGSLMHEEPQSALLWTILCLIPGINIVAIVLTLFWLTDFAPGHDRRFYGFVQNVNFAASQIGMGPLMPSAWKSISERSYVLYLIVSVLLPVFAIWWFYVLIKDLNDHFDNEWQFEDMLMAELKKVE